MMCAYLLKKEQKHGWFYRKSEQGFEWIVNAYGRTLNVALRFAPITMAILRPLLRSPCGFLCGFPKAFPRKDNGRINGSMQADQDSSFDALNGLLLRMIKIVKDDPGVDEALGFTGSDNPPECSFR